MASRSSPPSAPSARAADTVSRTSRNTAGGTSVADVAVWEADGVPGNGGGTLRPCGGGVIAGTGTGGAGAGACPPPWPLVAASPCWLFCQVSNNPHATPAAVIIVAALIRPPRLPVR